MTTTEATELFEAAQQAVAEQRRVFADDATGQAERDRVTRNAVAAVRAWGAAVGETPVNATTVLYKDWARL